MNLMTDLMTGLITRLVMASLAIAAADASAVFAQELKLARTAASGIESLLAHERAWDRNCNVQTTKIFITKQPEHGAVSVVQGSSTIPDSVPRTGSTGSCAGKTISGNEVMYKSADGYRGMDSVSYIVQYPNGRRSPTTIAITVD